MRNSVVAVLAVLVPLAACSSDSGANDATSLGPTPTVTSAPPATNLVAVTAATSASAAPAASANPPASTTTTLPEGTIEAAIGGSVTSEDGMLTLDIPPGAMDEDALVTIEPSADQTAAGSAVGDVYDLLPSGTTFSEPVRLTRRFENLVADGRVPLLLLAVEGKEGWAVASDPTLSVDGADLVVSGDITRFSPSVGAPVRFGGTEVFVEPLVSGPTIPGGFAGFGPALVDVGGEPIPAPMGWQPIDLLIPPGWTPLGSGSPGLFVCDTPSDSAATSGGFELSLPVNVSTSTPNVEILPGSAPMPLTIGVDVASGLLCDLAPIPGGTTFDVHFAAVARPEQQCKGGFEDFVRYIFAPEEGFAGRQYFPFEIDQGQPGRPFTFDGTQLRSDFDFGQGPNSANKETWFIDVTTFTGQQISEFGTQSCTWDVSTQPFTIPSVFDVIGRPPVPAFPGSCLPADWVLCLDDGRFKVDVSWDASGVTGRGTPTAPTTAPGDAGTFWFFSPDNAEIAVKVLNGCSVNNRFWVFAVGATNLSYSLTITDNNSGQPKTYANSPGTLLQPIIDTDAFATCP